MLKWPGRMSPLQVVTCNPLLSAFSGVESRHGPASPFVVTSSTHHKMPSDSSVRRFPVPIPCARGHTYDVPSTTSCPLRPGRRHPRRPKTHLSYSPGCHSHGIRVGVRAGRRAVGDGGVEGGGRAPVKRAAGASAAESRRYARTGGLSVWWTRRGLPIESCWAFCWLGPIRVHD